MSYLVAFVSFPGALASEPDGAPEYPREVGILSNDSFLTAIKRLGWTQIKANRRMNRLAFACINETRTAFIYVRKNGIDLRVFPREASDVLEHLGSLKKLNEVELEVRHSFANTTFNLYEGILRFAFSFTKNVDDLSKYFVPQGAKNKPFPVDTEKPIDDDREYSMSEILRDAYGFEADSYYIEDGEWS